MTLYLKYRPQKISELDLAEVRELLSRMLAKSQKPHAWLFAGPRGLGKTSAARILAKQLNCEKEGTEPCNECEMCREITAGTAPDVVEIDAASNRGIDEIRSIREKVALAPMRARVKVYIIDEVHMLTTEAANALLKTLEEPPAGVVFVLCTTEPEKLPATIVSRCSEVRFKKPGLKEITQKLEKINKAEGMKFGAGDLEEMAKAAKGSFRDAIKILEQAAATGKVEKRLGAGEFMALVRAGRAGEALEYIAKLEELGVNFRNFVESCVETVREELLKTMNPGLVGVIEGLEKVYERMKTTAVPQLPLEIFVIEQSSISNPKSQTRLSDGQVPITKQDPMTKTQILDEEVWDGGDEGGVEKVAEKWQEVLKVVRPKNHSVEALLRSTKPVGWDGRKLTLEVFYKFHKDKLGSEKCREIVEAAVEKVMGVSGVALGLTLGEKRTEEDIIKAAEKIFK